MQKLFKKLAAAAMALAMLVGTAAPVMADEDIPNTAVEDQITKSVTLHKLLMTEEDLAAWDSDYVQEKGYNGTQDLEQLRDLVGKDLKEIKGAYFAWQDAQGNYVKEDGTTTTNVDEALGGLTTETGITFNTTNLPKGTYKIVEVKEKSTYVGENGELLANQKAVPVDITLPLVNKDGVVENAHVYPKNTESKPQVDKDFKGQANAKQDRQEVTNNLPSESKNVGDDVDYEIETIIPAHTEYKTATWTDQMTEGLTFKKDSLEISIGAKGEETALDEQDYKLTIDENGFVLELTDSGLGKINKKDAETRIYVTYKATLNEKAVVDVPEKNDVQFHYGHYPTHGNTPKPNKPNDNGELTVTKEFDGDNWQEDEQVIVTIKDAQTGKPVDFSNNPVDKDQEATVTLSKNNNEHKWVGLDKDREYIVEETFKAGDEITYEKGENGEITIINKKTNNPNPINPEEPTVVTYGHRFEKIDQEGKGLAGAEFIVKNEEGTKYLKEKDNDTKAFEQTEYAEAEKAYKDAVKAATTENPDTENIANLKAIRDAAYAKVNTQWELTDNKDEAYKFIADKDGYFKVTGLKEGTYKLEETKQPEGYAKLAGDVTFTVAANSSGETTQLETGELEDNSLIQIENKLVSIPQTGGIGTIIFTIVGIALMAGAYIAMKKNKREELA